LTGGNWFWDALVPSSLPPPQAARPIEARTTASNNDMVLRDWIPIDFPFSGTGAVNDHLIGKRAIEIKTSGALG
jgi:hypothetical protein